MRNGWRRWHRAMVVLAAGLLLATTGVVWLGSGAPSAEDTGALDREFARGHVPFGPRGANFWNEVPPTVPSGARPGDIHWVQPREDAPPGARGWNVVYVSEVVPGQLRYVSGEIYVPVSRRPAPRSVVLWNHETAGNSDVCAPSRRNLTEPRGGGARVPALAELLRDGHVVVMSDYPGLGLPGPTFYMAGAPNARPSLDVVKAAQRLPGLNLSDQVVMYGWSQGGQTSLWAAQLAASYAPQFKVVGAALIAPASDIRDLTLNSMRDPRLAGYVIATLPGIKAANPELRYEDFLTPEGLAQFPAMADGCYDLWGAAAGVREPYRPGAMNPGTPWSDAMARAQAYDFATMRTTPMITFQGGKDTDVPAALTRRDRDLLCAAGVPVDYREDPNADHATIVPTAAAAIPDWFRQRLSGAPPRHNCP